jgi:hypothetical protein
MNEHYVGYGRVMSEAETRRWRESLGRNLPERTLLELVNHYAFIGHLSGPAEHFAVRAWLAERGFDENGRRTLSLRSLLDLAAWWS